MQRRVESNLFDSSVFSHNAKIHFAAGRFSQQHPGHRGVFAPCHGSPLPCCWLGKGEEHHVSKCPRLDMILRSGCEDRLSGVTNMTSAPLKRGGQTRCSGVDMPVVLLHSVVVGAGGLAQWEFTTDILLLEAAFFAAPVRANDNNPMLNQGVVGAFVFVRTLSNIHVSPSCSFAPLMCTYTSCNFVLLPADVNS